MLSYLLLISYVPAISQISSAKTTLNEVLKERGRELLPNDYNLTFVEYEHGGASLYSPDGKTILHQAYGISIFYEDEHLIDFPDYFLGGEYYINIHPYEYRDYTALYVGVRQAQIPQRTVWENSSGFKVHMARQSNGRYALMNRSLSKVLLAPEYTLIAREIDDSGPRTILYHLQGENQKRGLANDRGRIFLPVEYDYVSWQLLFGEYRILTKHDTAGLINTAGKILQWGAYESMEPFKTDGDIYVERLLVKRNGRYGLLDKGLKMCIPTLYDTIVFDYRMAYTSPPVFREEDQPLYRVYMNDLYGLYNGKNEIIVPARYERISMLAQGYYLAENANEKTVYSIKGAQLEMPNFIRLDWFPHKKNNHRPANYMIMTADGTISWRNAQGGFVKKLSYDNFRSPPKTGLYSRYHYILAEKNKQWGVLNNLGEEVLAPVYDSLSYFNYGYYLGQQLVKFTVNGSVGLLTLEGDTLLAPIYEDIRLRVDGLGGQLLVEQDFQQGLMDRTGNPLVPIRYDAIEAKTFGQCIVVQKDKKYGVYSASGKVLQPAEFRYYRQRYLEVTNQKVIELFNDEQLTDLTVVECE
jgi:hypothetical protein